MTTSVHSDNNISLKIKSLREELGWNQSKLAKESGITASAISMIENGQRTPSLIVIRKICDALRVSVSELTGETTQDEVSQNAQTFFRQFGDISDLSVEDQKIILDLAKSLKGRGDGNTSK